jgi:ankyrin repeat protein
MYNPSRIFAVGLTAVLIVIAVLILLNSYKLLNSQPQISQPKYSSLHQAAVFGAEQIQQLFDAGERLDGLDADGHTPLWVAVRFDKPDAVDHLLKLGAEPDAGGRGADTPLLVATFMGLARTLVVEQLIAAGADVNAVSQQYAETPLHCAVTSSNMEVTKLLLKAGADVNAQSSFGDTPLQSAVVKGNTAILDLLLASGADPELRNTSGFRPIDQLNACPNPEQVQAVFRAHGVDDQRRPELLAAPRATHEE